MAWWLRRHRRLGPRDRAEDLDVVERLAAEWPGRAFALLDQERRGEEAVMSDPGA